MRSINKRIKKKKWKQSCNYYTTRKQRERNKALCKRFPFLIPRSAWNDKVIWMRKPYDWTLVEEFPEGWWKAFGIQLCEELREECLKYNYLNQLRFTQIKEKYASLRVYTGPIPRDSRITEIINDYGRLSENICMCCSRPDIHMIDHHGWLTAICEDCFDKMNKRNLRRGYIKSLPTYADFICKGDTGRMADKRSVVVCYPDGRSESITYDLREKAEQIRTRWRAKHERMSSM